MIGIDPGICQWICTLCCTVLYRTVLYSLLLYWSTRYIGRQRTPVSDGESLNWMKRFKSAGWFEIDTFRLKYGGPEVQTTTASVRLKLEMVGTCWTMLSRCWLDEESLSNTYRPNPVWVLKTVLFIKPKVRNQKSPQWVLQIPSQSADPH